MHQTKESYQLFVEPVTLKVYDATSLYRDVHHFTLQKLQKNVGRRSKSEQQPLPLGLGRNGKLVFATKSLMRPSASLEKAVPLPTMMSGLSALDSKSTASLTAASSGRRMIGAFITAVT